MKRDVDLSRAILAYIEEHSPPQGGLDTRIEIEGYDYPTVMAHAELLIDDGYIDGQVIKGMFGPIELVIVKLTSAGHDAIAAAKSDTAWQKAKKSAMEHGVSLTFGVVVEIVKAEARKHLGLPP
jgi:hypothetical protein